jgi:hypothetical protein
MRNAYKILVGEHEGNRQLGRPKRRWGDNIRMDLRENNGKFWTLFISLRIGTNGVTCNCYSQVRELCKISKGFISKDNLK